MPTDHLELNDDNKRGFYGKEDDNDGVDFEYEFKCGPTGYSGPRCHAHHIIPATSVTQSTADYDNEKKEYINAVKHISDYNINWNCNLIGLPNLMAFEVLAQKNKLVLGTTPKHSAQVKGMIGTYNKLIEATRKRNQAAFKAGETPDGFPIHLPVNWGHTEYNHEVKQELQEHIWDHLNEKKKKHEIDAETVADMLHEIENDNRRWLQDRGRSGKGATVKQWKERVGAKWYVPFTMVDCSPPL